MPAPVLTIALEDGFDGDEVIVRLDGDVVVEAEAARSDVRIGLAYALDVPRPPGDFVLDVSVPGRGLRVRHAVAAGTTSVGISLDGDDVVVRASSMPYGYA